MNASFAVAYSGAESLPSRERGLKWMYRGLNCVEVGVAPLAGAWIEIQNLLFPTARQDVAPLAGAWIEMYFLSNMSLAKFVAPLAGAWIEIDISYGYRKIQNVAPLAGAWIEIGILRR